MKHSITTRLLLYFLVSFLALSLVLGVSFLMLFTQNAKEIYRQDLERRAESISRVLSELITADFDNLLSELPAVPEEISVPAVQEPGAGHGLGQGAGGAHGHAGGGAGRGADYGSYLRYIDEIALTDIWIVDSNLQQIISSSEHDYGSVRELPPEAKEVVAAVFAGETVFSQSFGNLLQQSTVTAGAPVTVENQIVAAVLLHAPATGVDSSIRSGLSNLLNSLLLAALLAVMIAVLLSRHFTSPLKKMNRTAQRLAEGDYTARSGLAQKDEIGELALSLDTLADRLWESEDERKRLEQMRQDFMADVSHELRTPVTVLRGSLEAICDGVVREPEQVEQYIKQMLAEVLHLQRLVSDFLDLSRLQNIDFQIEKRPFDLNEVLTDVCRGMGRIAEEKEICISGTGTRDPLMFDGDYGRVRQMLTILMDNAVKFSGPGDQVELSASRRPAANDAVIIVRDTGQGIRSQDLPFIFERFHRENSAENSGGSGLGLAIARQIARRHDIAMEVSSRYGEGTTFSLTFPLCDPGWDAAQACSGRR